MDNLPLEPEVKKPPPRRKPPFALYLMVAVSFSTVVGTVLLSRDMQHLRRLAHALGIDMSALAQPKPRDPVFQGPPRPSNRMKINSRFLLPPDLKLANAFHRAWQMTGPDMCKALKAAGIEPTEWQPAMIGANTFECSYDKIYRQTKDKIESSLFVIVRGDARGTIGSMRVKLVDPARDAAGNLDPQLLKIFETMLTQSRWGDFTAELEAIRTLKDVKKDGFGAALRFSQEFNDKKSFNFVLNLAALTPEQRRASVMLSESSWFEGARPQPPLELPPDPASPDAFNGQPVDAAPPPLALPPPDLPPPDAGSAPVATQPPAASRTVDPSLAFPLPGDPKTEIREQKRNPARFDDNSIHR